MPDVHLPHLDADDEGGSRDRRADAGANPAGGKPHRTRSLTHLFLEVVLISAGVFLGLMGEQWRERAHNRELAEGALRRFRTEVVANRAQVLAVKDYHRDTNRVLKAYLAADTEGRKKLQVKMHGILPVSFLHSAWDVALATQSLAYIDPDLAMDLATIYRSQQASENLANGLTQSMYLQPPSRNPEAFLASVSLYYDDMELDEPQIVSRYDAILPRLDRALGEPVTAPPAAIGSSSVPAPAARPSPGTPASPGRE